MLTFEFVLHQTQNETFIIITYQSIKHVLNQLMAKEEHGIASITTNDCQCDFIESCC